MTNPPPPSSAFGPEGAQSPQGAVPGEQADGAAVPAAPASNFGPPRQDEPNRQSGPSGSEDSEEQSLPPTVTQPQAPGHQMPGAYMQGPQGGPQMQQGPPMQPAPPIQPGQQMQPGLQGNSGAFQQQNPGGYQQHNSGSFAQHNSGSFAQHNSGSFAQQSAPMMAPSTPSSQYSPTVGGPGQQFSAPQQHHSAPMQPGYMPGSQPQGMPGSPQWAYPTLMASGMMAGLGKMIPRPGSVTGMCVMLYIIGSLAGLGAILNLLSAMDFGFRVWHLLALLIGGYFAFQGFFNPALLRKGKGWGWALSLAIIGMVFGLLGVVASLESAFDYEVFGPLIATAVSLGIFVTLFSMCLAGNSRAWNAIYHTRLGHLIVQQTGKAPQTGVPGAMGQPDMPGYPVMQGQPGQQGMPPGMRSAPGMPGLPGQLPRPTSMPTTVWTMQGVLALLMLYPFFLWTVILPGTIYEDENAFQIMMDRDPEVFIIGLTISVVVFIGLVLPGFIGLFKGKFWARVYSSVILGILLLASIPTAIASTVVYFEVLEGVKDNSPWDTEAELAAWLGFWVTSIIVFVMVLIAFILSFVKSTRAWTQAKPNPYLLMMTGGQQPPIM